MGWFNHQPDDVDGVLRELLEHFKRKVERFGVTGYF